VVGPDEEVDFIIEQLTKKEKTMTGERDFSNEFLNKNLIDSFLLLFLKNSILMTGHQAFIEISKISANFCQTFNLLNLLSF
jgi:hypothetical protein